MSWLDEMAEKLKDKKTPDVEEALYNLIDDAEKLAGMLRKEYENATEREIDNALEYAREKSDTKCLSYKDLLKIVRVKLDD